MCLSQNSFDESLLRKQCHYLEGHFGTTVHAAWDANRRQIIEINPRPLAPIRDVFQLCDPARCRGGSLCTFSHNKVECDAWNYDLMKERQSKYHCIQYNVLYFNNIYCVGFGLPVNKQLANYPTAVPLPTFYQLPLLPTKSHSYNTGFPLVTDSMFPQSTILYPQVNKSQQGIGLYSTMDSYDNGLKTFPPFTINDFSPSIHATMSHETKSFLGKSRETQQPPLLVMQSQKSDVASPPKVYNKTIPLHIAISVKTPHTTIETSQSTVRSQPHTTTVQSFSSSVHHARTISPFAVDIMDFPPLPSKSISSIASTESRPPTATCYSKNPIVTSSMSQKNSFQQKPHFMKREEWRLSFSKRLTNTVLQDEVIEPELSAINYRDKFYYLLCFEESEHIRTLTEKYVLFSLNFHHFYF